MSPPVGCELLRHLTTWKCQSRLHVRGLVWFGLVWLDKGIEAGASLFKGFERLTMIRAAVIPSEPEMLVSVGHRRTSWNISSGPMIKLNLTGFPANHGETRFECEAIR